MPSSGEFSQTRGWIQVSYIAGGFFTEWTTREAQDSWGAYERNEFSESRDLHLPIHRMLNSLTWYLMVPLASLEQFSQSYWDAASQVQSPKHSHQIKKLSTFQNTGVGSLSLLQGILLTQESNQGLLRCRWIFYLSGKKSLKRFL